MTEFSAPDETLAIRIAELSDTIVTQGRVLAMICNAVSIQTEWLTRIERTQIQIRDAQLGRR